MSLNIFDGSFAFQRTITNSDSVKGSNKEFVPANDRDQFKVSNRANARAAERHKESSEDFAKFLKSADDEKKAAKHDHTAEAKNATERASDARHHDSSVRDVFKTQETSVAIVAPSGVMSDDNIENIDVTALLENLSDELRAFIDELVTRAEETGQKIVTDVIVASDSEGASDVGGMLGLFVHLAQGDDPEDSASSREMSLVELVQAIQDLTQDKSMQLVTFDLTPQEITELQEKIQAFVQERIDVADEKALVAFAAQIVSLIEPSSSDAKQRAETITGKADLHQNSSLPLPAKDGAGDVKTPAPAPSRFDGRYDMAAQSPSGQSADQADTNNNKNVQSSTSSHGAQVNASSAPTSGERFLQLLQNYSGTAPLTESITTPQQAGQALQSLPSSQASLTNVTTQSASAAQAHPATQIVSATIQKAVKAGEETNIKLRLDPPELGRVEVKMSIDKDNTAKIVLTVEKPETFLMLQRDADALHRAMADAGLNTQGDLSFELASENHDFNQSQGGSSDHASAQDDAEIIEETTLDVQIDPITGRVRTDILV